MPAQIVATRMGEDVGQSVVVENVAGGGATVETRCQVRAAALRRSEIIAAH